MYLRNKAFPYFDELSIIFGTEWATGDKCESPTEMVAALVKENSPEEGAKTATTVQSSPKSVQDDFFGVAVDLEAINDHVFDTPVSYMSKKNKLDVPIKKEFDMHPKKAKKNGSALDRHAEAFQKQMETVSQLCAATNNKIDKMETFFDQINVADDNKPNVLQIIMNLQGLSKEKAIRAFGVISADKGKTDSFLLMPDEESKLIYVSSVLNGEI